MKTTLSQFCSYIESLAATHKSLSHTPEKPAFHKFYSGEDIEAKLRSLVQRVPCIMVKDYDFRFQDNGADNVHKVREVEVIVVDHIGRNKTLNDIYAVWESTEEIGDELIMRMKYDKRRLVPAVIGFNLSNVMGQPVNMGVSGLFGTQYTIPVNSVRSNDIDKTQWSDFDESGNIQTT